MKKAIREIINSSLQTKVRLVEKDIATDIMEKKLFIDSILLLKEIDDRRDFMESELGLDMSVYEEKFLQVVENLLRIHYSKEQLALIQFYLYQVPLIDGYDGKIDLADGKDVITVQFETPEDVYKIINSIKKPEVKFGRNK
jgi:hypothetical protein